MPHPAGRRATIRDVAKLAGVSPTAVSFVLNDADSATAIPDATKDRIRRAAERVRYRPNATARLLRTSRSHTIGFITDEVASSPFAGGIISGAQGVAWASDKILMIVNTGDDTPLLESAVQEMLELQVEGIVYATMYHHEVRLPASLLEVPCVLLNCYDAADRWPAVVPDEVRGGRVATESLLQRGHRRIGFLNLNEEIPASHGRLQGYREALAAAGVAYDPGLVNYGVGRAHDGYRRASHVLDLPDPPTAFFCGNDLVAMGAYDAIRERGLRIPQDVAVIGFDNQEIIAEGLRPRLSSMELPHERMGAWAVARVIEGPGGGKHTRYLMECPYVPRESL